MSLPRRLGKAGRRWLLLFHRWAGIAAGLFFALWIGSGLVMLYVPFPALTEAERLSRLAPIAWDQVAVAPDAALRAGGLAGVPAAFGLEMRGDEPVYRIAGHDGTRVTVSARTGARLGPLTPADALRVAAGGAPAAQAEQVARDQWTVTARYDPLRPFLKVALGDAAGTELYVSAVTGEIALDTTRFERGWNWVGSVAHWIYLTPLRARPELWRTILLWLSGFAALGALSGGAIGIWRLRLRRRYAAGAVTPYRGLARWHHLLGLAGGLGLSTFIVSGWISMNPNRWFSATSPPVALRAAYAGIPPALGLDPHRLRDGAVPDTRTCASPPSADAGGSSPRRRTASGRSQRTARPPSTRAASRRPRPTVSRTVPSGRSARYTPTTPTGIPTGPTHGRFRCCACASATRPPRGSTSIPGTARSSSAWTARAGSTAGCSTPRTGSTCRGSPATAPCTIRPSGS